MAQAHPNKQSMIQLMKATFQGWSQDGASRLAAAFAYYAIFSMGPLLLITIAVVSVVYGPGAERDEIRPQVAQYVGNAGAAFMQEMISKARFSPSWSLAGIASLALLIYAATNIFTALQTALNLIFDVEPKPGRGLVVIMRDRALAFLMVALIGGCILASIVLSTALANVSRWGTHSLLPGHPDVSAVVLQTLNFLVSALLFTGIFALLFKYLPDIQIDWKDTLIGAAGTSLVFSLARLGLAFYLSRSSTAGPFGAAGSLVIVMLFIYYSAQVMFLGAEFTQVWACRSGHPIKPSKNARWIGNKSPLEQKKPAAAPAGGGLKIGPKIWYLGKKPSEPAGGPFRFSTRGR